MWEGGSSECDWRDWENLCGELGAPWTQWLGRVVTAPRGAHSRPSEWADELCGGWFIPDVGFQWVQ